METVLQIWKLALPTIQSEAGFDEAEMRLNH
jgi:hypothetical protein